MSNTSGYIVITHHKLELLNRTVEMTLDTGWSLSGGVSFDGTRYLQSMYKISEQGDAEKPAANKGSVSTLQIPENCNSCPFNNGLCRAVNGSICCVDMWKAISSYFTRA